MKVLAREARPVFRISGPLLRWREQENVHVQGFGQVQKATSPAVGGWALATSPALLQRHADFVGASMPSPATLQRQAGGMRPALTPPPRLDCAAGPGGARRGARDAAAAPALHDRLVHALGHDEHRAPWGLSKQPAADNGEKHGSCNPTSRLLPGSPPYLSASHTRASSVTVSSTTFLVSSACENRSLRVPSHIAHSSASGGSSALT